MVGYDPKQKNLSAKYQAYASVATSVLTRLLAQPFDVLKIRFQVQYEPISNKSQISKYKSLSQTVSTIIKDEGYLALWKGHLTGQLLSVSYTAAQFFWFELLTRTTYTIKPELIENPKNKVFTHFICGGLAASFTIITNQPIDTVRTRFVCQGEPRIYKNIPDAVKQIYAKEGLKGFYKGTVPAIILVTPESAFRFGIYQFLNSNWSKIIDLIKRNKESLNIDLNDHETGMLQSTINGSVAGVLSKTIVYPFDLAKKRLQIQGFEDARKGFGQVVKFNGLANCFYLTIKKEGFLGLYKGFYPSMLKAAMVSGLTFLFYEEFTKLFRKLSLD